MKLVALFRQGSIVCGTLWRQERLIQSVISWRNKVRNFDHVLKKLESNGRCYNHVHVHGCNKTSIENITHRWRVSRLRLRSCSFRVWHSCVVAIKYLQIRLYYIIHVHTGMITDRTALVDVLHYSHSMQESRGNMCKYFMPRCCSSDQDENL